MSNIWHDISPSRIQPDDFVAVIEIPKGSKKKYELDKETGLIILDRVLHTSTHYPANYGFIPRTYGDDGDPLDVLVLCSEEMDPLTLVRCYPIGYISMLDGGKNDEKIVAIPFADPTYTVTSLTRWPTSSRSTRPWRARRRWPVTSTTGPLPLRSSGGPWTTTRTASWAVPYPGEARTAPTAEWPCAGAARAV